jgi:DNA-binding phage protein
MRLRSRHVIALVIGAMVLIGAGVALAHSQTPSPSPSSSSSTRQGRVPALERHAFLDIVARRLGITRSKLDAALKATALADVKWSEDNGFITKAEADFIRERINSGEGKGRLELGFHGLKGGGLGRFGPHHGLLEGRPGRAFGQLTVAANYLGLSEGNLVDALRTKTLAQVARDQGKTVDGLKAALRAAKKADLDAAVTDGRITQAQENALLQRFDSQIGDIVNGVSPAVTDLARRLGVDRAKLITAIKNAAIEQVDAAVASGRLTRAQADAIKQRIRSGSGFPFGGGIGPCGGPGGFGLGFGRKHFSLGGPGMSGEDVVAGL